MAVDSVLKRIEDKHDDKKIEQRQSFWRREKERPVKKVDTYIEPTKIRRAKYSYRRPTDRYPM